MLNVHVQFDNDIDRIQAFLGRTAPYFIPRLDLRVDISAYSQKLADSAVNIFLSCDGQDVAHAAFYTGRSSGDDAFLTSFCVNKDWWGARVAEILLREVERGCKEAGCSVLRLEVASDNYRAKSFYVRHGFRQKSALIDTEIFVKRVSNGT